MLNRELENSGLQTQLKKSATVGMVAIKIFILK
jgi:hypothetical protein